ncbi:hypothetical protein [Nioella sediminis]|jgi:hypothetical protein|uniref:hypothetical protein n=1 Tax=Nioella sediminis TaxID=1912092 RepID=UPI000B1E751D|nr:hypothetical protein [Nioella sediminis]
MGVFLAVLAVFLLAALGLGLGLLFGGKPVQGSCSGLSCGACETCPNRKASE